MKRKKTPGRSATGIANDVFGLGKVFVSDWKVVANRTWIDREYLEDAFAKADALMKRVGVAHPRARSIDDDADPVVLRSRLSALLVGDLDRIRQAVTYVRWEEGDVVAPPEYEHLRPGCFITHPKFGRGKVVRLSRPWSDTRARIAFDRYGSKTIVLAKTTVELL